MRRVEFKSRQKIDGEKHKGESPETACIRKEQFAERRDKREERKEKARATTVPPEKTSALQYTWCPPGLWRVHNRRPVGPRNDDYAVREPKRV